MKKEIEELQDVWLNECDKKQCPIIDYLLHQKKEAGSNAEGDPGIITPTREQLRNILRANEELKK